MVLCWIFKGFPLGFTFGSPSDDAQLTSERKREHLPLPSSRPAAFPLRISLRKGEWKLFGGEMSFPKRHLHQHVHFLSCEKEIKIQFCPCPDAFTILSVLLFSSPLFADRPVPSGESTRPPSKQMQVLKLYSDPALLLFSTHYWSLVFLIQAATSWLSEWMLCFCFSGDGSATGTDGRGLRAAGHSLSARMQWKPFLQGVCVPHCKPIYILRANSRLCYDYTLSCYWTTPTGDWTVQTRETIKGSW